MVSGTRDNPPPETTRPPELSRPPKQLGVIHINSFVNFTAIQGKVNSPRVTQEEGCLRYPRPCKWGLGHWDIHKFGYPPTQTFLGVRHPFLPYVRGGGMIS